MATYHVHFKSGERGTALAHFNYITRADPRHDSKRHELIRWEPFNFPKCVDGPPDFFYCADQYERANGSAFREIEASLPNELSLDQNWRLAKRIAKKELGPRPYVVALHNKAGSISGQQHPHMHAMYSDRACDGVVRTKEAYFSRYNAADPAKGGTRKLSGGLSPSQMMQTAKQTRKSIGVTINKDCRRNGIDTRVDHRSLKDQGIDGPVATYLKPEAIASLTDQERADLALQRQKIADSRSRRSKGA